MRGAPSDLVRELGERARAVLPARLRDRAVDRLALPRRARRRRTPRASRPVSRRAYQTSTPRISPKARIRSRYRATAVSTTRRRSSSGKPFSRPAIARLAARRLTSHSQGPGSVSSKSLTSKTSARSGDAKPPKFDRCASPHSWTRRPDCRRRREVGGHDRRRAAVEGERRRQHALVADRDEVGDARALLCAEELDRVRAAGRGRPLGVAAPRRPRAGGAAGGGAVARRPAGHSWVGSFTTVTKKSSISRTTSMKRSKSTGFVTYALACRS